jgi:hypothetical protein
MGDQGPVRLGTYRRRAKVVLKWWTKNESHDASSNQLVQAFLPHAEAVKLARKELMELYARMEGMQRAVDKASSSILQAASQVPPLARPLLHRAHPPPATWKGYLRPTHVRRLDVRLDRAVRAWDAAAGGAVACVS